MEFDTVIRGGTIVDGTRLPRYRSDIGIKNGKIAKIGRLKSSDGAQVLDAEGLIVAPGAIDLHTHYDAPIHWDPYCSIGSWHGVTSVTIGNCGFGFAPVHAKDVDRAMHSMERTEAVPFEAMKVSMPFDWETFPQWLDHLDRIPKGINLVNLVPVNPLVSYVMGGWDEAKNRFPNDKEMAEILRLFHGAMAAGAGGWATQRLISDEASVQRDYDGSFMISDTLPDEFYLTMAKALGQYDRGCTQITQFTKGFEDPEKGVIDDMRFCGRLAELSNRSVMYNALAVIDKKLPLLEGQLATLRELNAKGIPLVGQGVTMRADFRFTFEDWNLFDNVPSWREATLGTFEERKRKLADPSLRKAMREEYDRTLQPKVLGDMAEFIAAKVESEELEAKYEGLSAKQIAEREHKHVVDAILDLSVADNLKTEWVTPVRNQSAENCKRMLDYPYITAGISDGGAHMKFQTLGAYPTDLLVWMVREKGYLTLEDAHFHLSYLPAFTADFNDRGCIREGLAADILVYDLEKLAIKPREIVHDVPPNDWRRVQRAEGYRWIMVNGQVTFEDGKCSDNKPGKLLRHGYAS
jgi:N-acyl-D-aspartate/D-glutamate deacylase